MKIKRTWFIVILLTGYLISGYSQTIENPNSALKSHETLLISKVELSQEKTVVHFSIENRIENGNFCADRNIFLIDQEGKKYQILKTSGIPVCPDSYKFRNIGEVVKFTLEFPPLESGTKWIDIIENCSENCFWFYGVTLDNELNKRIDEAFSKASTVTPAENLYLFKSILDDIDSQNLGIEGLLYLNIISAARENADNVNAMVWYKRLAASKAPRVGEYLKYLNDRGVKY
ncbi:MAG: hypothetical protein IPH69_09855 [Bacteroidales bacterium]|nr:hypothetical protein [Bacteroidales bacterium]